MSFLKLPTTSTRGDHFIVAVDKIAFVTRKIRGEGPGCLVHVGYQNDKSTTPIRLGVLSTTLDLNQVEEMIRSHGRM